MRDRPAKVSDLGAVISADDDAGRRTRALDLHGFERAMQALEAALHVEYIATFDLVTCSVADTAQRVLENPSLSDFDQIPVRDEVGLIVRVLHRSEGQVAGLARDVMSGLEESLVIAAEDSLIWFV